MSTLSRKIILFIAGTLILPVTSAIAQLFVFEDFNSVSNPALPAGWMATPASQWITGVPNTVTPNALNALQFSLNNAMHTKVIGIDGTQAASDGAILSSPTISIPAAALNTILRFDIAFFGIQSNATPPQTESLVFIVSTDGGLSWSDVSFVAPVANPLNNVWEAKSLFMGAYAGQNNLKFGFRYRNQGGNLIGAVLDNIRLINGIDGTVLRAFAGSHPDPSTGIGYHLSGSNATLTGTVQNTGSTVMNSYFVKYKVGTGTVQSSPLISTPLAPSATASFPAGLTVAIPANASFGIKAWIEATGDVDPGNDTASATTVGVPYFPTKRPVFEEGTGTWCGWCPRGTVFMDHFAATHPNGVAAQIAVHNNDPMMLPAYDSYMTNYADGFPNLVVDRIVLRDPRNIDTAFAIAQNNFGFADFSVGAPVINGDKVSLPVFIKPVVDILHPKLALIITESNVKGSGSNWSQNNYYSGGSGMMGGWEKEASPVSNVLFHFVARSITPSAGGSADSLPQMLSAGTTYSTTLTAALDTSTWKLKDLQYTAIFINGNNTSVMNSAFTSLPVLSPTLGNSTLIKDEQYGITEAALFPNPTAGKSYLNVTVKDAGEAALTLSDRVGRKLFCKPVKVRAGSNILEIDSHNIAAGTYFLNFATEKANIILKMIVAE